MKIVYSTPKNLSDVTKLCVVRKGIQIRGRFQTIFGKINVIMTLGGRGVRALMFTSYIH